MAVAAWQDASRARGIAQAALGIGGVCDVVAAAPCRAEPCQASSTLPCPRARPSRHPSVERGGLLMRFVSLPFSCSFERLPGLPSSRVGLQSLTGELDSFTFDSYLGCDDSVDPPVDIHSAMEQRLGMRNTKPLRRGAF